MANRPDYYRLLQVHPDAATEVIRASYRTLMQKLRLHPDLGGDVATAALINEAYRVLCDETLRAAYDADTGVTQPSSPSSASTPESPADDRPSEPRPDPAQVCAFCKSRYPGDDATTVRCYTCRAPLYKGVVWGGAAGLDVRRVPRLERRIPLNFLSQWPQTPPHSGTVEDLSVDGMRFTTDQAVTAQAVLKLECELLDAVGRVLDASRLSDGFWSVRSTFLSVAFKRRSGGFVRMEA